MLTISLKTIVNLFYPLQCLHCGKHLVNHETLICLDCYNELPFTSYTNWVGNPLEQSFTGRVTLEEATALLFFRQNGVTQHLIHLLKYKNKQSIGRYFGQLLVEKMITSNRFKNLDGIVMVPLHPKKQKIRGYNQLQTFAEAISKRLNIPIFNDALIKTGISTTQTKKDRQERFKQFNTKFSLNKNCNIDNKHLLLIDDVVTSGATIEACTNELLKAQNIKISIATMAIPE